MAMVVFILKDEGIVLQPREFLGMNLDVLFEYFEGGLVKKRFCFMLPYILICWKWYQECFAEVLLNFLSLSEGRCIMCLIRQSKWYEDWAQQALVFWIRTGEASRTPLVKLDIDPPHCML